MNVIKDAISAGKPCIGTICHTKSAPVVEALGYSGLQFVMLDQEHAALDLDQTAQALTAATAAGLGTLVRVSEGSREHILHMLDLGAGGVIVPGVTGLAQVRALIDHAKFPPVGNRGYCMTRDGGWGYAPNSQQGLQHYMQSCNDQTLLMPQCETVGCLEEIEEITALEGVDGILIGPYDLSIALGHPGELEHPEVVDAIARIIRACRTHGKIAMTFCGTSQAAGKALAQGCQAVLLGLDLTMLINAYRSALQEIRFV